MPGIVLVGAQWGDEGKGKIVDLLAQSSHVVLPVTRAGPMPGTRFFVGDETFKIRQTPSGVILMGKTSVIGAGYVVDPWCCSRSSTSYDARGIDTSVDGALRPTRT